jgi:hypothetical protein
MISRIHAQNLLTGDIVFGEGNAPFPIVWLVLTVDYKFNALIKGKPDVIVTYVRMKKYDNIKITSVMYSGTNCDNFLVVRNQQ